MSRQQQQTSPEEDAERYAIAVLGLSMFALVFFFSFFQYILLSVRCFPSKIKLTKVELFGGVVAVWVIHQVFDMALQFILDTCIKLAIPADTATMYVDFRNATYNVQNTLGFGSFCTLLVGEVAMNWLVFLLLVSFFDSGVPLLFDILQGPFGVSSALVHRFNVRIDEVTKFIVDFIKEDGISYLIRNGWPDHGILSVSKYCDISKVQRQYITKGRKERNLVWNFTVRECALDELKEVLGPIGRYGELGFYVAGNVVSFEASGIGCTARIAFQTEDHRPAAKNAADHIKTA